MNKTTDILIIQTAFLGDTILASSFAYQVKKCFPLARVHFFLREGNESLIDGLDFVDKVWVWEKSQGKYKALLGLILTLRKYQFEYVFNLHRHFNSGLITARMKAKEKIGFKENPLSFFYTQKVRHLIPHDHNGKYYHEVQRNLLLLKEVVPSLEISDEAKVYPPHLPLKEEHFSIKESEEYLVVAPTSVWFTKQWELSKYLDLIKQVTQKVYLIGAPSDREDCEKLIVREGVVNLCGKLSLLESAALMKNAKRVIVNDSAPLHLASAVNAKTTAIFCSTTPRFGYFPLAQESEVVEVSLDCKPCGLHGHQACPLGHFHCSQLIETSRVIASIR